MSISLNKTKDFKDKIVFNSYLCQLSIKVKDRRKSFLLDPSVNKETGNSNK